jgi:predicted oxidoreductase
MMVKIVKLLQKIAKLRPEIRILFQCPIELVNLKEETILQYKTMKRKISASVKKIKRSAE